MSVPAETLDRIEAELLASQKAIEDLRESTKEMISILDEQTAGIASLLDFLQGMDVAE